MYLPVGGQSARGAADAIGMNTIILIVTAFIIAATGIQVEHLVATATSVVIVMIGAAKHPSNWSAVYPRMTYPICFSAR
jgi:hypothetical protein